MTSVNFFSEGFFGYSDEQDFFMGSIWHILPIALMVLTIILIYVFRNKIKNFKYETSVRYILAFVMMIVEMSYFWRLLYVGSQGTDDTMMWYLPIQMCQWGLIICIFTIISKNRKLFSINYYITFMFAGLALAYPLVIQYTGPRYYRYYQFWLEHILPIICVCYLMIVHGLKPDYKGIYRSIIAVIPLLVIAMIANSRIDGASYLYLTLDVPFLPDNQVIKAIIISILGTAIAHLMYLPFYKINKKLKSKNG